MSCSYTQGPDWGVAGSRSEPGSLPLITGRWISLVLDSWSSHLPPIAEGSGKYLNKVFHDLFSETGDEGNFTFALM